MNRKIQIRLEKIYNLIKPIYSAAINSSTGWRIIPCVKSTN
jgi:hypothetical protein